MPSSTLTSISRVIRCSSARKPPSRSSSTKRCTRKRCCICGIGCRSSRSNGRQGTRRRLTVRCQAPNGSTSRPVEPRSAATAAISCSAGTTSSQAWTADVAAFSLERHDVTNAAFLEFIEAGGYRDPQWWRPEDWAWVQAEHIRHPLFWERHDTVMVLARHVRSDAAALGVARLREPCRGLGVRQVARRPPADGSRVPASRLRHAVGRHSNVSVGRGHPDS